MPRAHGRARCSRRRARSARVEIAERSSGRRRASRRRSPPRLRSPRVARARAHVRASGTATSAASLATPYSPRNCSARHSARVSPTSDATERLSSRERHTAGRGFRCGSRSQPPRAAPSRGASSAPGRRRVRPRTVASQSGDRFAESRTATSRCTAGARRVAHVRATSRSAALRFAASRSRRRRVVAARSASSSAQAACRSATIGVFARLGESFARVHAHRFEEPVPAVTTAEVYRDERLLREAREHVGDLRRREIAVYTDALDSLELEAARKDGEAAKQSSLVGLEQVVAPVGASQ